MGSIALTHACDYCCARPSVRLHPVLAHDVQWCEQVLCPHCLIALQGHACAGACRQVHCSIEFGDCRSRSDLHACHAVLHTSASLTINENASPDVPLDLADALDRIAPEGNKMRYRHDDEGPDDMPAHIKSSLMGPSLTVPIAKGRLALGTWQVLLYVAHHHTYFPLLPTNMPVNIAASFTCFALAMLVASLWPLDMSVCPVCCDARAEYVPTASTNGQIVSQAASRVAGDLFE